MDDKDKIVDTLIYNIKAIDACISIYMEKIKSTSESLKQHRYADYKNLLISCDTVMKFLKERDGMMFALRVIDQKKYEEIYGNEH